MRKKESISGAFLILLIVSLVVSLLTILPELSIFFKDIDKFHKIYGTSITDIIIGGCTSLVIMVILFVLNLLIFKFYDPSQKIGIRKILLSILFLFVGGTLLRQLSEYILIITYYKNVEDSYVILYHLTHPFHDWITSLIIFLTSYAIYLLRKQSQLALAHQQLYTENIKNQYESLKNQLNPHMLFNSLNTLSTLVDESTEKSKDYIGELSYVLRYTLQESEKYMVDLEKEVSYSNAFIYLQKMRYEDNLLFNIDISDKTLNKKLPPLSLQLLIENAIKHNQVSSKKPLVIDIYTEEDNWLVVSNIIQLKFNINNINPIGIGLENLNKRYNLLFKRSIIVDKNDRYFTVKIPLITIQ